MDLYISPKKGRKSIGRLDTAGKKGKVSDLETSADALRVGHFIDDLTSKRVVKSVEGSEGIETNLPALLGLNPSVSLLVSKDISSTWDMFKADNSHLSVKAARFAYTPTTNYNIIYIPVNRLKQVYQTDAAINPRKVRENRRKMRSGIPLDPIEIGYDYDVHDGHHRWKAGIAERHTHVPCKVVGTDPEQVKDAIDTYRQVWKSEVPNVDLLKSTVAMGGSGHLNTSKLIKRAVQVQGKDGKTFTRMQWVNPEQASTGHGIRMIQTRSDLEGAVADGLHKHPMASLAMQDQGLNPKQHNFTEHPHFFLPETEQSAKSAFGLPNHIPHGKLPKHHKIYQQGEAITPPYKKLSAVQHMDNLQTAMSQTHSSTHTLEHLNKDKLTQGRPLIHLADQDIKDLYERQHENISKHPDISESNLHKFYSDMLKGTTQEGLEYVFSHPDGTYRAKLDTIRPQYDATNNRFGVAISMNLMSHDGSLLGMVERSIHKTNHEGAKHKGLIVNNQVLELTPEAQGIGVGSNIYQQSEDYWKHLAGDDDTHISLLANISVGGYAWAKKGFDFQHPESEVPKKQHDLGRFIKAQGLPLDETIRQCGYNSLSDIRTAKDFATLDNKMGFDLRGALKDKYPGESDRDYRDRIEYKEDDLMGIGHLGKAFMTAGTLSWKGYKKIKGASQREGN